jgi:hypothetical protein
LSATEFCPGLVGEYFRAGQQPRPCSWHLRGDIAYPSEYRAWLMERFRTGDAASQGAATIRLPHDGAVFYIDPSDSEQTHGVRIETIGFRGATVYLDGIVQGKLNSAGVFILPLSLGLHIVRVQDRENSAETAFEVK